MSAMRRFRIRDYRGPLAGFTLIELIVAMAVLTVLAMLLVQILGQTLQATRMQRQQMSATGKTRAVLDAVGNDLASLVALDGLSAFYRIDAGGNVELAFLTRSRRPETVSAANFRFATVVYRLDGTNLERESAAVAWNEPLTNLILRPGERNALAGSIVRFEAVATLDDGSVVPLQMQAASWNAAELHGEPVPGGFLALAISTPPTNAAAPRVTAITVAVAALDDQTLEIADAAGIGADLPDPELGKTPYETWSDFISSGQLSGHPAPALAALRIAQRTYPLK